MRLQRIVEVDGLVAAAGGKVLDGVTAQNARERARVLKRHADNAYLGLKWAKFREIVKEDDVLLDSFF